MRRRTSPASHGQSLVEFALLLPVLLILVLALVDAGRAVISYTALTNAARVGARVAIVNQSNDATCGGVRTFKCAAAAQAVGMGIAPGSISDVAITGSNCAVAGNCDVTVTVTYPYQVITPLIGLAFPNVNLTASATMRVERVYANP